MIERYRRTQPAESQQRFFAREESQVMQTLITVGIIVLVFALITALLVPVMRRMTRDAQLEYELRRDGVTVQGQIISRHEYHGRSSYSYYLKYRYAYEGISYEREREVQESIYIAHPEGTEVSVICLPRHPKTAHLLINGRLEGLYTY
jgi:flagellar biosynthesis/type III secretory pathway M-ring protein FliF/YscJ